MTARFCPTCGAPALVDDVFCGHCGASLAQAVAAPPTPLMTPNPAEVPRSSGGGIVVPYSFAGATPTAPVLAPPGTPWTTSEAPVAASGQRALGASAAAMLIALFLLMAQALVRAGEPTTPRLSALIADLVPSPLALVLAFWLGAVLLAFADEARSWLAAIGLTQVLFGLGVLFQTGLFERYLREAALLPTLTVGVSRGQVLSFTVFHTLCGCAVGMWLAQSFASWRDLRPHVGRRATPWIAAAIAGSIVALVLLNAVHEAILRLSVAATLALGGRWVLDVGLTAVALALCAVVGGVVGWTLANGARKRTEPELLHAIPARYA